LYTAGRLRKDATRLSSALDIWTSVYSSINKIWRVSLTVNSGQQDMTGKFNSKLRSTRYDQIQI